MGRLTGLLSAACLLLVALGSPLAAQSPSPDATPNPAPTSLDSATPSELAGMPGAVEVLAGPEALASEYINLPLWPEVLDTLGKRPEDLQVAIAQYQDPSTSNGAYVVVVALRVDGVTAPALNAAEAVVTAAENGWDVSAILDSAEWSGTKRIFVQPGSDDRRWSMTYPSDDVLYWVAGSLVSMEDILAELP